MPLSNPVSKLLSSTSLSHPSETDCWVSEQIIFKVWGCQPHAQPPTWRTRVSIFVWVIALDLFGMEGPTSNICYHQHSSWVHVTTQAPPLHQSRDTFREVTAICSDILRVVVNWNIVNFLKLIKFTYNDDDGEDHHHPN